MGNDSIVEANGFETYSKTMRTTNGIEVARLYEFENYSRTMRTHSRTLDAQGFRELCLATATIVIHQSAVSDWRPTEAYQDSQHRNLQSRAYFTQSSKRPPGLSLPQSETV